MLLTDEGFVSKMQLDAKMRWTMRRYAMSSVEEDIRGLNPYEMLSIHEEVCEAKFGAGRVHLDESDCWSLWCGVRRREMEAIVA